MQTEISTPLIDDQPQEIEAPQPSQWISDEEISCSVHGVFLLVMHHEPTSEEMCSLIDSTRSLISVTDNIKELRKLIEATIVTSPKFIVSLIKSVFWSELLRAEDQPGLRYYLAQVQNLLHKGELQPNATSIVTWLENNFQQSEEYQKRFRH